MVEGDGVGGSSGAVPEPPGASAGARTVFLSYASADAQVATQVCEYLESHGVSCWMAPRDVEPGAQYADAIVRAINDAKALVLVLSASSVGSAHVGREIERAASKRKQIIALKIDAALLTPALEYFLSESQWIDVAALGMQWAMVKLVEALAQRPAAAATQTPPALGSDQGSGRSAVNRAVGTSIVAKRVVIAAATLIVLAVGGVLAVSFWPTMQGGSPARVVVAISDKSIAVLPFTDMSQKKDQEYFGDGMAEEILDLLAKIPGLTVIGRTSSFQFKGKNEDLRKIGTELNAAYVLEGSVRNSGDQVRITAQLINTRTGAHEWSETYDRPIGDVLKLQDAIAAAVVRELQLTVDPGNLQARSALKNAEAYDVILRGRHASDRWDKEGDDEAVSLFLRALDRDAASADASAELAFAYYKLGVGNFLTPPAAFEQARGAASTALRFDLNNSLAHYVLGKIHIVYDWDWTAAKHEFQQVATLAQGSPDAPNGESRLSLALGHWDQALRQVKAALALDPLDPNSFEALTVIQMSRRHLPEAEAAARRLLDIRPTYAWGHYELGLVLLARGDRDAALLEMQKETAEEMQQWGLAITYHELGRRAESDAALARLLKQYADRAAFGIADVYASRGQSDEAMHWLERAQCERTRIWSISRRICSREESPRTHATRRFCGR
jgi:TolB-like protein